MAIILLNLYYFLYFMEIYMFLFHAETNAFSHRVTSYNREFPEEMSH